MKFIYRKNTGEVVMRLNRKDSKIDYDKEKLEEIDLTVSKDEAEKIEQNYTLHIREGKLKIATPGHIVEKMNKQRLENLKASIEGKGDVKKDDLLELINILTK